MHTHAPYTLHQMRPAASPRGKQVRSCHDARNSRPAPNAGSCHMGTPTWPLSVCFCAGRRSEGRHRPPGRQAAISVRSRVPRRRERPRSPHGRLPSSVRARGELSPSSGRAQSELGASSVRARGELSPSSGRAPARTAGRRLARGSSLSRLAHLDLAARFVTLTACASRSRGAWRRAAP